MTDVPLRVAVNACGGVAGTWIRRLLGEIDGLAIEPEMAAVGGAGHAAAGDPLPAATLALCESADAILFATPEYNYSIPGVLKNAIDQAARPYGDSAAGWDCRGVARRANAATDRYPAGHAARCRTRLER